jgi:hypothetical protein
MGQKVLKDLLAKGIRLGVNELATTTHQAGNVEPSALNGGLINIHIPITSLAAHCNSLDSFRLQRACQDHLLSVLATSCTCHREGL